MAGKKSKKSKQTKSVRPKPHAKKRAAKKKPSPKKKALKKTRSRGKSQSIRTLAYEPSGLGSRSGGQSGDLQGLSNRESSDSESVDELLEEGNAYEAEIVQGVQDADDADKGGVRSHESSDLDNPNKQ